MRYWQNVFEGDLFSSQTFPVMNYAVSTVHVVKGLSNTKIHTVSILHNNLRFMTMWAFKYQQIVRFLHTWVAITLISIALCFRYHIILPELHDKNCGIYQTGKQKEVKDRLLALIKIHLLILVHISDLLCTLVQLDTAIHLLTLN